MTGSGRIRLTEFRNSVLVNGATMIEPPVIKIKDTVIDLRPATFGVYQNGTRDVYQNTCYQIFSGMDGLGQKEKTQENLKAIEQIKEYYKPFRVHLSQKDIYATDEMIWLEKFFSYAGYDGIGFYEKNPEAAICIGRACAYDLDLNYELCQSTMKLNSAKKALKQKGYKNVNLFVKKKYVHTALVATDHLNEKQMDYFCMLVWGHNTQEKLKYYTYLARKGLVQLYADARHMCPESPWKLRPDEINHWHAKGIREKTVREAKERIKNKALYERLAKSKQATVDEYELVDGMTPLITYGDYVEEGNLLNHCISSRYRIDSTCYAIRTSEKASLEISYFGEIIQLYASCNKAVNEDTKKVVRAFLKANELKDEKWT